MTADRNLFAQQDRNRRLTRWLLAGFVLFFLWVGFGGDLSLYLLTRDNPPGQYRHVVPFIGLVATAVGAGIATWSYRTGPERVLWATGAWEIVEPADAAQRQLVNVVEEMAIAGGVPRPRVWVVPDGDPNAFATGRDPQGAHVAVTEGLLRLLSRDELQGVVAHEMAHVRNYDVRLMTVVAALVGAIALLSDGLGRTLGRSGARVGGSGGSRRGGKDGGNPIAIVLFALWVFTLLIAPVISRLIAMAVSRKREYLADATAAQLTRHPLALASALEKLEGATAATRTITKGAAHLCIVDPSERRIANRPGLLGDVFASHPPMAERIRRLRGMGFVDAPSSAPPDGGELSPRSRPGR